MRYTDPDWTAMRLRDNENDWFSLDEKERYGILRQLPDRP